MSKETVYVCDRCECKGREGFTHTVYFTYGRRWDGVENSDDDAIADLCGKCACDMLRDFVRELGHVKIESYIEKHAWLKKLARGAKA